MATYTTLQNGSRGPEVEKLQDSLLAAGYNVTVDGQYGPKTAAAVRQYQQDNGLTVDGMAGEQTLGKLYQPKATQPATAEAGQKIKAGTTAAPDYSAYEYDATTDDAYMQALAVLQEAEKATPTYAGTYDAKLEEIYDKIVNRDKFKYDVNGDALYQQLAAQYQQQGKMAMEDTMGQAAAMTGGYGNSYAVTAGNQAYQGYLQKINEMVPELHDAALARYNAEGEALMDEYALTGDLRDEEYGRYQDALDQHWRDVDRKQGLADDAYNRGRDNWYTAYQMGVDADNTRYEREQYEAETAYGKQQDAYSKLVSLITTTGYTPSAQELQAAGMSKAQAQAYADYYTKQNTKVVSAPVNNNTNNNPQPNPQPQPATVDYSDWDAGDWQGYFARIRQSEGADAAKTELKYFTDKGLIPKNMLSYASIGARGSLGH